jgi:hypothetical protein
MREAVLDNREQQLIKEFCGSKKIQEVIKTNTIIDAGRWFGGDPLWLCFLQKEIIILALGKRRFIEKFSFRECKNSYYCHTTGELVLEPIEKITFKRFQLTPLNALRALDALGIDITQISNHHQEAK